MKRANANHAAEARTVVSAVFMFSIIHILSTRCKEYLIPILKFPMRVSACRAKAYGGVRALGPIGPARPTYRHYLILLVGTPKKF